MKSVVPCSISYPVIAATSPLHLFSVLTLLMHVAGCAPAEPALSSEARLGPWVDFLPARVKSFFLSQYVEERDGHVEYCVHYLFRKR